MNSIKFITAILSLTLVIKVSCSTKTDNSKWDYNSKMTDTIQKDTSLNGLYAGLEEMCWTDRTGKKDCYIDPARPGIKWYHLGYLKIKDDSVFLDQNPISISSKDTLWSSSDGAFYYYSGTLQRIDTAVLFNLDELFCDYCGVPIQTKPDGTQEIVKRTKQLKGHLADNGIIIDGFLYARTTKSKSLISEHPEPFIKSP